MIKKIESKRVEIPPIFLVETKEDFDTLPAGIPYIVGNMSELPFITTFLEFQVLFKSCLNTKIPIKWLDCLKRIGFNIGNIKEYSLQSGGSYWHSDPGKATTLTVDDFVQEQYFVDFDALSRLKILPTWLEDLKTCIETNIIDEVAYNPLAFNKQLGMNVGYGAVKQNKKNLLILDISGSIPDSIRMTIIQLSKLMSKRFYADIIFTGGTTVFIEYEKVFEADMKAITDNISRSNEGEMFKAIVEQYREYGTCISFGDDDAPDYYSSGCDNIKPNFKIETLYSLHTKKESDNLTGYCKCFTPKTVHKVKDWVKTINK